MSEVNPFVEQPYLETARERVTEAWKEKEVFDKFLQLLVLGTVELQTVLKDLMQLRSIDTAVGAQLDILGDIVGQPRELLQADLYQFFGFQGALNANSYGDVNNPAVGGRWRDYGQAIGGNIQLDDDTYRLFIKAKIYKNTTTSTPEEFIQVIKMIFGNDLRVQISEGVAEINVLFGRTLSTFERVLIDYVSYTQGYPSRLITKTVGVGINFGEFRDNDYFGFQGAPGAKGYGDLIEDPSVGYGTTYGQYYGGNRSLVGGGYYATLY